MVNAHRDCYRHLKAELQQENMHADKIKFVFGFYKTEDTVHARTCPEATEESLFVPEQWTP